MKYHSCKESRGADQQYRGVDQDKKLPGHFTYRLKRDMDVFTGLIQKL